MREVAILGPNVRGCMSATVCCAALMWSSFSFSARRFCASSPTWARRHCTLPPPCKQSCQAHVLADSAAVLDLRHSTRISIQHNLFSCRSCDDGVFSLAHSSSQGMPWVSCSPRTPTLAVLEGTSRN
ncbi:hypothetical protein TraAM80_04787 [Trypanosoma rangeli]|uniref:Uncharacterized protein n=1 Tax=Trypanosoma rangeli TaxID=5698 RepID=A0A422NHR4_TRYRA|nr:uncharacterized protein TraAM80_04787 [Trypanosoma rangeli]RNF05018.1 hypothetical protein TraAM80_04787 [Trypanosoma rangeli]|eukprot:RNF05018.1 hypothetical protein TraAM80_04787 [Trypanosoma rangeli]